MSQTLLQLDNIACERDDRILFSGLSLQLCAGDVVQLEGPNGSGKTTLLRILTGLSNDFQGELRWCDQPMAKARNEYLSQLLYIGHLAGIKKGLTPRENLQWLSALGLPNDKCSLEQALAEVGLYGFEDVPCEQLSAGQTRRVALARLYLSDALVWVLDEPFTAIDKQGVSKLESLFAQHAAKGGCVLLTTHQDMQLPSIKKVQLQDYSGAMS